MDAAGPGGALVLTGVEAIDSAEYQTHLSTLDVDVVVVADLGSRRAVLDEAMAGAVKAGARLLVIPDGDLYLLPLLRKVGLALLRGRRLPPQVSLLLMRTTLPGGPEPWRPPTMAKPVLALVLSRSPNVRLHFLTNALGVVQRRSGYKRIQGLNDPPRRPDSLPTAGPDWFPPRREGSVVVGVLGVISKRKNVPMLLAALAEEPDMTLVVGGKLDAGTRGVLDAPAASAFVRDGRLVVQDRLLTIDEFSACLASVDIAAVLHDNDAPSGVLAEACARFTAVVVAAGGWLAEVARSTGVGLAAEPDGSSVAAVVRKMAGELQSYRDAARHSAVRLGTDHFTTGLLSS